MLSIFIAIYTYELKYLEHPEDFSVFFTCSLEMGILHHWECSLLFDRGAESCLAPLLFLVTLWYSVYNTGANVCTVTIPFLHETVREREKEVFSDKDTETQIKIKVCLYLQKNHTVFSPSQPHNYLKRRRILLLSIQYF